MTTDHNDGLPFSQLAYIAAFNKKEAEKYQAECVALKEQINSQKAEIERLRKGLTAIQNSPGGGPAKRIAMQLLQPQGDDI